jgi:EmrB/QacA subfamily drug resistance transporter
VITAVAMFMTVMDTQIVNVALATLTRDFHSTTSASQWVITAYALSLAVCVPASGWVGDRFGTKRTFVVAAVLFTSASALCAAAPSLTVLIVLRILQGVGGGLLTPVGFTMMYRAHPAEERVAVARLMTILMILAPASAPLIGGVLIATLSWRWIFLVNLPVGLTVLPFAMRYLDEYRHPDPGTYDPAGLVLGGSGIALFLYALSEGPIAGWRSPQIWLTGAAGLILLMCFLRVELVRRHPMLDLRLLATSRLLRSTCVLLTLQPIAFISPLIFTSLYIQESRGFSALTSGTTTFPEALAIGACSGIVARCYPRVGPRRLTALGFAVLAIASLLLSRMDADTNLWLPRAWSALLGVGSSFVSLPLQAAGYAQISSEQTGQAAAIINTAQRAGAAAGLTILSAVLTLTAGRSIHPPPAAFHPVFLAAASFAFLAFVLSWRIRDSDAANTMARSAPLWGRGRRHAIAGRVKAAPWLAPLPTRSVSSPKAIEAVTTYE